MDDSNQFSDEGRIRSLVKRLRKEFKDGGSRLKGDLSPEERAELKAAFVETGKMAERSEKYMKDLLRRLGVRGNLEDDEEYFIQLWAAGRYLGFSTAEFWALTPREFCAVLELKVGELELHAGDVTERRNTSQPNATAGQSETAPDREPELEAPWGLERKLGEEVRRRDLLAEYKRATADPSNKRIYEAKNSGIHKPQFYQWLRGKLSPTSETTINFERFLVEKKPPVPRTPRP